VICADRDTIEKIVVGPRNIGACPFRLNLKEAKELIFFGADVVHGKPNYY
jgi:hypothetical protein